MNVKDQDNSSRERELKNSDIVESWPQFQLIKSDKTFDCMAEKDFFLKKERDLDEFQRTQVSNLACIECHRTCDRRRWLDRVAPWKTKHSR